MKTIASLACSILLMLSSTVFAQESWVPANGKQCSEVCTGKMKPISLGEIAGNKESFVCSGEGPQEGTTKDKGFRGGFTTGTGSDIGCAVCAGDKCQSGRIPSKFMCLCIPK